MFAMSPLARCALLLVCVSAAATALTPQCNHPPPHCQHTYFKDVFRVSDNLVKIYYIEDQSTIEIECNGWNALDSPALPHFKTIVHASNIRLVECPPPADISYRQALTSINVTLLPSQIDLQLTTTPLTNLLDLHFNGMENLTSLSIQTFYGTSQVKSDAFSRLTKLRKLALKNVILSITESQQLPPNVSWLWVSGATVKSLPESLADTIKLFPKVQNLTMDYQTATDLPKLSSVEVFDNVKNDMSSLEELTVKGLTETSLKPFESCENLRSLKLFAPKFVSLPERWVISCTKLQELFINHAENLISLPENILERATALKTLTITNGVLKQLPNNFLAEAINLKYLDLSNNQLHSPSYGSFYGPALKYFSLAGNDLMYEAKATLAAYMGSYTKFVS